MAHRGGEGDARDESAHSPGDLVQVAVDVPADAEVDELVLAFRKGGTLHELATVEPPVEGELRTSE